MRKFLQQTEKNSPLLLRIFKLLIVFTIVNVFLIANSAITQLMVFRSTAIVKSTNIGVYWDINCSSPVETIDWGKIELGEVKVINMYIRNEGNSDVVLSVYAIDWDPTEATNYVSFNCDHQGQIIRTESIVHVKLVLSLSQIVQNMTNFSFNVALEISG